MAEMTLVGLRVVHEVAALGSFTAAAEALGYTQSAVSRQVAAMESAAGTTLFERGARGVVPTPTGSVLVRHAAALLAGVELARHEMAGLTDQLAGRLAMGAFPTAASVLVPRALAVLAEKHPALVVRLREASSPAQLRQLRAGRIEVAVIAVGADLPQYDLDGLRRDALLEGGRLSVAVPESHRLAAKGVLNVDDLAGEVWIAGEGADGDPQFGAWPTLVEPRIGYVVREWPTRLGLVAAGLGISLFPGLAAASAPLGIRVIPVEDPSHLGRSTVALTLPNRTARAAALVQALRSAAETL